MEGAGDIPTDMAQGFTERSLLCLIMIFMLPHVIVIFLWL